MYEATGRTSQQLVSSKYRFLVLHSLLKEKKNKNHRNEFWEGVSKISGLKHLFQITFVLVFGKMRIWSEIKVHVCGLSLTRRIHESLSLDSVGYLANVPVCPVVAFF